MEVDPALLGVGATILTSAVGYGVLQNKVQALSKYAIDARGDRQNLFKRISKLETETALQAEKICNLEGARSELFQLIGDTKETVGNLVASVQVLTAEFKKLEEEIKKK